MEDTRKVELEKYEYRNMLEDGIKLDMLRDLVSDCVKADWNGEMEIRMSNEFEALLKVMFPVQVEEGWRRAYEKYKAEKAKKKQDTILERVETQLVPEQKG